MASPVRTSLAVLLSAVLVLLLIVCANLANLLLARGSARAREYGLRIALGVARGRLLVSALVEPWLLSLTGGALGILAAQTMIGLFVRSAPVDLPRLDEVQVDRPVVAFALAISAACGLLFGLIPAMRMACTDPQSVLRPGGYTLSEGRRGLRLRAWLVGGEAGLSALLLILAGLLIGSLARVLRVDRGFTAETAVAIHVRLPNARYRDPGSRTGFFDRALDSIRALPGVRSAAVINRLPLTGESNVNSIQLAGSDEGALDPATRRLVTVNVRFMSAGYFSTLGIPLLYGRTIEAADRRRNVAAVSSRLAAKLWPGQNPLGKRIRRAGSGVDDAEVIGVVGDVHSAGLETDPTLMVYVPYWKRAFAENEIVVRSRAEAAAVLSRLAQCLAVLGPGHSGSKHADHGQHCRRRCGTARLGPAAGRARHLWRGGLQRGAAAA